MKATRTVTWTTKDGKTAECKIEITREIQENISYSDGWNINLGPEEIKSTYIELRVNGKYVARDLGNISPITKEGYRATYDKMVAAGVYARLGDVYINRENYEKIMAAITEATTEAEQDAEYIAYKATPKATKIHDNNIIVDDGNYDYDSENHGPGWCNKCHSYCWGDCEA